MKYHQKILLAIYSLTTFSSVELKNSFIYIKMTKFNTSLTIPTLLQQRSEEIRSKCSLRFLHNGSKETDSLTFEQLMSWSNEIAIGLSKITKPGDSAILSFPAGLEFIACFYACLKGWHHSSSSRSSV